MKIGDWKWEGNCTTGRRNVNFQGKMNFLYFRNKLDLTNFRLHFEIRRSSFNSTLLCQNNIYWLNIKFYIAVKIKELSENNNIILFLIWSCLWSKASFCYSQTNLVPRSFLWSAIGTWQVEVAKAKIKKGNKGREERKREGSHSPQEDCTNLPKTNSLILLAWF